MNTTALAIMQPQELEVIQRTGRLLAASGYFDGKGESAQAIAMMATKIMAGREMGFGPFASVNGIHIISGKPSIGANLMASAVKGSGRYDYRVKELTSKVCKIEFLQRSGDKWEALGVSEFTIEEATAAELTKKEIWKKHPKNMLFARALSNGVRWYTPDVFSGNTVYIPEELGADVDGEGNVIEATVRVVDTSTGEVNFYNAPETHQKAEDASSDTAAHKDNPFDEKPRASVEQLKELDELGGEFYKDKWETQALVLAKSVSTGATENLSDLMPQEIAKLIDGIKKRLKKAVETQDEEQVPDVHY